jgi:hypothetical protein
MSLVQSAGLVNPQNAHFSNPGFSSRVGAVSGCSGTDSALALQQKGLYQVVKTGGKRNKRKSRRMKGGNGYGFSQNQSLSSTSGVNSNGSVHIASITKYENNGINSDTNMNASKQSGQAGGSNDSGYSYGTGGYPYYSYKPSEGENLSVFAGSGYPPISRGLNSQCGGKKRRSLKKRKSSKKRGGSKKVAGSKNRRKGSKQKATKKRKPSRKQRQRGGYSQYMSNVAHAHNYSTGAPPALTASESALANPTPYTPSNDCLNTWKHLGDSAPYNIVYK